MEIEPLQYMALAQLSYSSDLPTGINPNTNTYYTISELLGGHYVKDPNNTAFSQLSSLSSWSLISYQPNTASGFSAIALQAPDNPDGTPGQIVFSFRGTEPYLDTIGQDVANADFQIALQESLPAQFTEAENFVNSVLNNSQYDDASYSFTGHSLGGALASYMTYVTNTDGVAGVGKSVTFNAPGIAGLLPGNVDPSTYIGLVTDHVNEGDFVGEFRANEQLGRTIYHFSNLAAQNEDNVLAIVSSIIAGSNPLMNPLDKIEALATGGRNILGLANGFNGVGGYHEMGDMLTNGNMNSATNNSEVQSSNAKPTLLWHRSTLVEDHYW